ncbi:MAG: hypothetical protein ACK4Y5_16680 [Acetobacteraceae bacterium]|jgi:hypothetical protein
MTALVPLNDMQTMAAAMSQSGLFGVKNTTQALALMLVAQAEGQHPATIAQDYDIIQGRAARKTHSVMARFQAAGGSVQWHELTDAKASATFAHPQGGSLRMEWTFEQARKAGLTGKDNWKNYPRAMLRARCIAEGVRAVYPGAIGGLLVAEEARDMAPAAPQQQIAHSAAPQPVLEESLMSEAEAAARQGVQVYAGWWKAATKDQRKALAGEHERLKTMAEEADRSRAAPALPPAAPAAPAVEGGDEWAASYEAAEGVTP